MAAGLNAPQAQSPRSLQGEWAEIEVAEHVGSDLYERANAGGHLLELGQRQAFAHSEYSLGADDPDHVDGGVPNLRRRALFGAVDSALRASLRHPGFRVVHFVVQTNHLHLLVEAYGARALSRGMQGLAIRLARGVNRAAGREGKIWRERFHARILRSPREVRNAVCYVLQNTRRHATTESERVDPAWIDPRSSAPWFDGWREEVDAPPPEPPPVAAPRTWLLSRGWRRHGLVGVGEVPAAAVRPPS